MKIRSYFPSKLQTGWNVVGIRTARQSLVMRNTAIVILNILVASAVTAQQPESNAHIGSSNIAMPEAANLPVEQIGKNDLIGITVYDCPELTRTVRVDSNADIHLPMLLHPVHAGGLYPSDLEHAIVLALVTDKVLIDPIVSVSIVEFRSRPISVVGAVKSPVTFQATGSVTVLEALSQAGGLAENAGAEIIVHKQGKAGGQSAGETQQISIHDLYTSANPSLNFPLQGGEVISVPPTGQVYVLGNVKKPGAFPISDGPNSSVLKAVALSGGLDRFSKHTAYIYRLEEGHSQRTEIPIGLKKILNRQTPDIPLQANDILYIPDAAGLRASLTILDRTVMIGAGLGATLLYVSH